MERSIDVHGWSNLNSWNSLYIFISSYLFSLHYKQIGSCLTDVTTVCRAL